jgi:predicted DsbA family dithiol-disulfide isomerase
VIEIDVWSDIACPWCYLGKRRLAAGLAATGVDAQVTWHAFELQPDMPSDGLPSHAFYDKKFGAPGRWAATFPKMTALGAADGVTFAFEAMLRAPNTRLAHRAIRIAHALEGSAAQDAVVEACFRAHFTDGVDISNREALLAALAGTPVDPAALAERLDWDESLDAVLADQQVAAKIGISGVPFFVAQGKLAMSGAQPANVFAGFLEQAKTIEPG